MSEPRRLLSDPDGATPFERGLLESYSAEQPSAAARTRALGIASVAAGTVATIGVAAGAGAAAPKAAGLAGLAVFKWVVIGVAVAGAATAVVVVRPDYEPVVVVTTSTKASPVAPAKATAAVAPTPQVTAVAEVMVEPPAISPADLRAAPSAPAPVAQRATATPVAAAPAAPASGSLPAEIAALDRARKALEGGDPAQALDRVDAYELQYPNGTFSEEAEVLRIEALAKRGDRARATSAGQRFLAAHPTSPHAARIRAILTPSIP